MALRALVVVGEHQFQPGVGAIQAPGGVDARGQAKADRAGVDGPRVQRADRHQRPQARLAGGGQRAQALPHQAPVLAAQRNAIGHGGQRHQVEVAVHPLALPAGAASRAPRPAWRPRRRRTGRGRDSPPTPGWTIGASGRRPSARGWWWSVTTTSMPAARAAATSSTAVMAQSTVTSRAVPRAASRGDGVQRQAVATVQARRAGASPPGRPAGAGSAPGSRSSTRRPRRSRRAR